MRNLLFITTFFLFLHTGQAQIQPVHPIEIITGHYYGLSKPLRDIPAMSAEEFHQLELKGLQRTLNKDLKNRIFPFAATALPRGTDPAWQDFMGATGGEKSTLVNFEGQTSPYYPPDCNGTAGPDHFMQTINMVYAIYDKSGTLAAGPANLNLLFQGVAGSNFNDGDPIILYDDQADRWLVTEFSISGSINYMLMAVSTTNDPTGTWHKYSFQVASMPDYPKFSVWRDGYYMGDNNGGSNDIYVFERDKMLTGSVAKGIGFSNAWRPSSVDGFMCVPPIDNDGPLAPAGTPGLFIAFNDDALGGGLDQLWLYELTVDWTTPSNSAFVRTQTIDVQSFNSSFGNNWNNIEQKGTTQRLDGIPQVIMNVPQYRNFGSYQTIVCCHTVNVDGARHAGIRWYELRKTTASWTIRQQGTYAPDANSRWMGSIMLNGNNEIGLGYSISSTSMFPGIFFCGQSPAAYLSASGILDIAEDTIKLGAYSQTGANRWGDYSQMSVDPADDKTFWFTNQYVGSGGSRKTKIASFRYNFAPDVATLEAQSVDATAATLNGSVNPNGLPATYHFEYGLTPGLLNLITPVKPIDAGSEGVKVNALLADLLSDTTYFFKIVAVSSGGTAEGGILEFSTLAAPFVTVTPSNQNASAFPDSTTFIVTSNTSWIAESDALWCTVTSHGNGNDTITASFTKNLSVDSRIAHITVTGMNAGAQLVTVTQAGAAPELSVTPVNQNASFIAGSTAFSVASNTNWTVTCNSNWCAFTPSGSGNGTVVVDYTQNTADQPRVANIEVSVAGIPVRIVTVTQAKSSIGISEMALKPLLIFPNPTPGKFKIVPGNDQLHIIDVWVQDVNGKIISLKTSSGMKDYQIDLSSASAGTYSIIVKTETGLIVEKVVVVK